MPDSALLLLMFALLLGLLALGQYVHTVLLSVGVVGIIVFVGTGSLGGFLRADPFSTVATFSLTTIPLFVLMSQFVVHSGIVRDLYALIFQVSRGRQGVLGALTIVGGGALGAVAGSGTATAAALGRVSVPELIRHGYHPKIADATAASAGSMSGIMPPSILLIIYASVAQVSIGRLFIGAIIPSFLLIGTFLGVSLVAMRLRRDGGWSGAPDAEQEEDDVAVSLGMGRIVLLLGYGGVMVAVIFGGIYTGFFTPTEAGGVGAAASLVLALFLGRVTTDFLKVSVLESLRVSAMVLLIMVGAQIFSRFVSLSLLPRRFVGALEGLLDQPILTIAVLLAVLFVLFMFIEGAAVTVMAVPILLPVALEVGVDPIWFGVATGLLATLGLLTPPVGLSVYALSGVTGRPAESVFPLTTAFAFAGAVVVGGLMIAFPEIVTWLPQQML